MGHPRDADASHRRPSSLSLVALASDQAQEGAFVATHVRHIKCGSTIVIVTDEDDYEIRAEPESAQTGPGGPADPPIYDALMIAGAKLRLVAAIDPDRFGPDLEIEEFLRSTVVREARVDLDAVDGASGLSVLFWAED